MDYPPFYIVYLCVLTLNFLLCLLYYVYHDDRERISSFQPIIRILLISTITIWLLDSVPYLYLNPEEFSITNITLSNIFAVLIGVSAIFYEISLPRNIKPKKIVKNKSLSK